LKRVDVPGRLRARCGGPRAHHVPRRRLHPGRDFFTRCRRARFASARWAKCIAVALSRGTLGCL